MDNVYFCPHAFVLFQLLICCDKYKNIISQQTNNLFWYSKLNCFLYMCLFIMLFCFRLGESCSHVAALLFKVEAAVRLGYTRRACTELPCYWNNDFVKKVKPAPVHSIQFYKKSATKTVSQRNRYATPSIATDREKNSCWIVSPTAHDSQSASVFSRNTAIHFAGRQQPNWSDCHVTSHRFTSQVMPA